MADVHARARALITRPAILALGVGVFLAPLSLQALYWHHLTGHVIVDAYPSGARVELTHPHLLAVAFRKGLFFWTPLAALALAGLPFLRSRAPALMLAPLVTLALKSWVVASWSPVVVRDSFGQRAFVDTLPLLAIGLAALFDWARATRARAPVAVAAVLTSSLAMHAMVAYW